MTFGQPIRKHLPAESELPKSVEFSATEMIEQNGSWVATNPLPIPASLPHHLPADESVDIVHDEKVNLSTDDTEKLITIPVIDAVQANKIIEERKNHKGSFHTYKDLESTGIGEEKIKYLQEQKWIKLF